MTLLHEGLRAVGLAWDEPPATVVAGPVFAPDDEQIRPAVPVVRTGNTDPVAFEQAARLVRLARGRRTRPLGRRNPR